MSNQNGQIVVFNVSWKKLKIQEFKRTSWRVPELLCVRCGFRWQLHRHNHSQYTVINNHFRNTWFLFSRLVRCNGPNALFSFSFPPVSRSRRYPLVADIGACHINYTLYVNIEHRVFHRNVRQKFFLERAFFFYHHPRRGSLFRITASP